MQTNPVWRMVRALIATYILSGILLAILSFALFKFRLPENQVNLAVCAVYILSCFFGGMIAGNGTLQISGDAFEAPCESGSAGGIFRAAARIS